MPSKNHVHKLKRHVYNKADGTKFEVYFCVLNCSYRIERQLSLGKQTICWRCGEPFAMNEYSIRLAKPHCPACTTDKHGNVKVTVTAGVSDISGNIASTVSIANDNSTIDDLRDRLLASISSSLENGKPDDDLL